MTIDELIDELQKIREWSTYDGVPLMTGKEPVIIRIGMNDLHSFYVYSCIAPNSLGKEWCAYIDLASDGQL